MAAAEDPSSEPQNQSKEPEERFRLRLQRPPEAVIVITKHNRIVLAGSPSWDERGKEIIDISIPGGFRIPKAPAQSAQAFDDTDLPVELLIGKQAAREELVEQNLPKAAPAADLMLASALMREAEDAFVASARDGTITCWNAGAHTLLGYSEAEALGRSVTMLIPRERRTEEQRLRNRALAGEHIAAYDTVRLKMDGAQVEVSVALSLIRDAAGSIMGTLEIARDISNRREADRGLAEQISELTRSNRELEAYALVVAHDLQAPLNSVTACFTQMTQRYANLIGAETVDLLNTAADGVQRMHKLIKDLLDLARIKDRIDDLVQSDCAAIIPQVLADLDLAIRESKAKITVDPMPKVQADPTQLAQVFQNLISNAIRFRGSRVPEIHVGAELRAGEWHFSVSDNGIGIEPDQLPRLFQPLQRLHPDAAFAGSGLGLAIARKILTRHGGRIWAESKPGVGSTFYFTLRANDSAPATDSGDKQH